MRILRSIVAPSATLVAFCDSKMTGCGGIRSQLTAVGLSAARLAKAHASGSPLAVLGTAQRARLIAQTDLFAGGSVRLPRRAGWREEFVAELLSFPGRHDDQVDALTQGLAWSRRLSANKICWDFLRGSY
jgi:hypothetical protein